MTETLDIKGYAPAFAIEIEGKKLHAKIAGSINSVTITQKMGQADYFSFKVQDKMEGGQLKLMNNKLFSLGNKVSVSIGYHYGNSVKMQGHIEEIIPKFEEGDIHTFDVAGKDKALARLAEESEYKCYTKKTDSDIVKEIAKDVGLSADVDDTPGPPPEKKEKKGGTSYLFFIEKMVRQNKGYEFFVSDGKLVFRQAKIQSSPVKTLEWGMNLINFNPQENLSRVITGVTVRWWDEKKQKPIIGEAGVNDETPVGSGNTAGKIAKEMYGDIEKTITDEPVESKSEAKNIAISVLCDTNKELVTADAKTMGMPEIQTGEMIEIKGLSLYSGKYYIYAATHTIDNQGYSTEFCVRRNTR